MIVLSVHLITYNNEKHIEETLVSILNQKVDFTFEIVVGDDCSTDRTLDIIKKYADAHPNLFKVSKNEKQLGILKNFKNTLDRCQGRFVFDIAGDDLLNKEDALQKMVAVLQNNSNLGFVDCGYDRLDDNNNSITLFKNKNVIIATEKEYKKQLLLGKITPIGHCYNKAHLYKYVDFDTYLKMNLTIEDYPILVDMVMNSNFSTIKESLHVYRIHDGSHSHQYDFEGHLFQKQQMKQLFDYFTNKYRFSKQLKDEYSGNHYKELLFLAGYFKNKTLGKETFPKINQKSLKDFIHYYASQYSWIRKLIAFRKGILNFK